MSFLCCCNFSSVFFFFFASCVGVWENNAVTVIANQMGNRTTPSWIAYTDTERLVGEAAKNQAVLKIRTSFILRKINLLLVVDKKSKEYYL